MENTDMLMVYHQVVTKKNVICWLSRYPNILAKPNVTDQSMISVTMLRFLLVCDSKLLSNLRDCVVYTVEWMKPNQETSGGAHCTTQIDPIVNEIITEVGGT